jgi:UDP-2,4-diacetamido-2,4,6-trideoxy-beta-L-altropyranose hydrolase
MGTGHLMRCMALAQAWQSGGGHSIFSMAMRAPALEDRLRAEAMGLTHFLTRPGSADDARQTVALARQTEASVVVVDGYHFDAEYQRIIKEAGFRLLFIDDYGHADYYWADIVMNQNIHAHAELYSNRASHTQLLLGTRYVLLRREFLAWRGWKREIPLVGHRVLVTLGGCDPDNVTLKVIQGLQEVEIEGLEAVVVVGGSNPHYEELQSAIRDSSFCISLQSNVKNMPDLMAWADVAVSAGGSTSWELAFMGLPSLVLILSNNQRPIAERLDGLGVAVSLGSHENLSSVVIAQQLTRLFVAAEMRAEMAQRGRELVDGEGTARVLMCLEGKNA